MNLTRSKLLAPLAFFFLLQPAFAQDDLMDILDDVEPAQEEAVNQTIATFKTTRLVIGQSAETNAEGVLNVLIGHRFGRVNGSVKEFFGLDNATIRLGLEYGITNNLNIGFGRSSFEKTYDGFLKYRVLRQSTGKRKIPMTITLFASMAIKSQEFSDKNRENYFTSRMYYAFQVMFARKFSERLSFQLTPTLIHRNLVATKADKNDVFAIGAGGRVMVSRSVSINAEYNWLIPGQIASTIGGQKVRDSFSLGVDIETGGHVFQVHVTNSRGIIEKMIFSETNGDITKGDLHIGFNISRVFTVYDKNKIRRKREEKRAAKTAVEG
ncbi:MAG: DUF5777 family beta-barrel protein [Flavobacteriales bacterium]|nr:DUF5777 family beta-barrel protein [Flavobacteriales bacterium]